MKWIYQPILLCLFFYIVKSYPGQSSSLIETKIEPQQIVQVPSESVQNFESYRHNSEPTVPYQAYQAPSPSYGPPVAIEEPNKPEFVPSPAYGPPAINAGAHAHAHNLNENKPGFKSEFTRLLLSLPGHKLSLLQPVVVGLGEAGALVTHQAAGITSSVAHGLPEVTEAKAHFAQNLIRTSGKTSESLLHLTSALLAASAGAKTVINERLPHAFQAAKDVSNNLAIAGGNVAHVLAQATNTLKADTRAKFSQAISSVHGRAGNGQDKVLNGNEATNLIPPSSGVSYQVNDSRGYGWNYSS